MTEIHRALERQAQAAPEPDGLLERVLTASARRRRRRVQRTVLAAAVVIVVAAVAIPSLLWRGDAPSPAAERMGTGDVAICFDRSGDEVFSLTVTEWAWGERVDSQTEELTGGESPAIEQPVVGTDHTLIVAVRNGPLELPGGEPVEVSGMPGLLGNVDGTVVLVFESGVGGTVIRLSSEGDGLTGERLLDWAAAVTVHTDASACTA